MATQRLQINPLDLLFLVMQVSFFLRLTAATASLLSVVASSSSEPGDEPHRVSVFDATVSDLAPKPPGAFDMYILAQSWQPAFCFGKEQEYPGCRAPQSYWRSHLTLHGLWPELSGSAPPSFCSGEAFDAGRIERELGIDTLHQYWPDVKFSEASPQYADFWKHEWTRHGTCSGLKQVDYFTHAINLERNETLAPTPQFVQDNAGRQVDVKNLREAFGDAALKCQHSKRVTMFSQSSPAGRRTRITCRPSDAPVRRISTREDSCGKGSVTIPAFPADD